MMLQSGSRGGSLPIPAARRRARHPARRGFVLVTMLCCTVVLVAFLGLAIDSSYLELVKTRMQAAADAAALGGAQEIKMNGATNVVAAARGDAALNGFTHGQNAVTVTVNNPPSGGYSTSDSTGVEVIVAQQVPTFFMGLVSASSVSLQSRAVAHQGGGTTCLHLLDPSASGAFSISGNASLQTACGIIVESSSATAFTASGNATVTAPYIGVYGGKSTSGNVHLTPTPTTGAARQGDPLAYVPAPSVGACNYTNTSVSAAASVTLPPGVYCNGITVSGTSTVTFSPAGTFIMKGGGLHISGNSTVSGSGVTIYNTSGSGYSYGAISISGNSDVTLSAPTTGSLAGVLIFQDRSIVSGSSNSFSGTATLNLNGALYFPTTHVDYSGDVAGTNAYSIIVAKTATFSGNTRMNNDYSSLPAGNPIKGSALVSE
jgi:Putative Flp pilus-assembly TadE/G-like